MVTRFVARRDDGKKVNLYERTGRSRKVVRDVRWGDYLNVVLGETWSTVRWGTKRYEIKTENLAKTRPLEVIFLDVGQGDGALVISPEFGAQERIMLVDAGISDNMYRFVRWRFGKFLRDIEFHAAVVTHPDQDHYRGFQKLFGEKRLRFKNLYHNGLLERTGGDVLGPSSPDGRFLTDIAVTRADVDALYSSDANRGRKRYPKLMHSALTSGRVDDIQMLSSEHGEPLDGKTWMPGFAPGSRKCSIEVLGPVPDMAGAETKLRWFGDKIGSAAQNVGKTKNGHSLLLRLCIGNFRLLLGGDLNRPAEDYLLRHYSGIAPAEPLSNAVAEAKKRFQADILKSCHHGAADVTDEFLSAVHPLGYVVSSGDEESHAHPRPDLLGRLGKMGRSDGPLVLCTEILRSTAETSRTKEVNTLRKLNKKLEDPTTTDSKRRTAKQKRTALLKHLSRRTVGVYGAITLRTEGDHMEVSFRLEKPRGKQLWQRYSFYYDQAKQDWMPEDDGAH